MKDRTSATNGSSNVFDLRLTGPITTVQPLAHCPPLAADTKSRDNVSRIGRLATPDGLTGFINGSAWRGPVRRCADLVVRKSLGNPKVPFVKALQSRVGGAKGSEETNPDFALRQKIRLSDPVLGLFGAGSTPVGFLPGRIAFSHLIPSTNIAPTIVRGVRRAENRSDEFLNQLSTDEVLRAEAYGEINAQRSKLKAEVKRLEAEHRKKKDDEALGALLETKKAELEDAEKRASNLGTDNAIGMPLAGYEVFPIGTVFNSAIVCRSITEGEAAVLIAALTKWAFNPRIGAKEAYDCGVVRANWKVEVSTDDEWVSDGKFTFDGTGSKPEYTGRTYKLPDLDLGDYLATV